MTTTTKPAKIKFNLPTGQAELLLNFTNDMLSAISDQDSEFSTEEKIAFDRLNNCLAKIAKQYETQVSK